MDSPTKRPRISSTEDGREVLPPLFSIPVHSTFGSVSEIVSDLLENEPDLFFLHDSS